MSKKILAVDIDEVLSSLLSEIIRWHNEKYKSAYKVDDFFSYDYWNVWGGTRQQAIEKVDNFAKSGGFAKLPVIEGSQEAIKKLKNKYKIFSVTSRRNDFKDDTYKWIERNFPDCFEEVLFGNHYDLSGDKTLSKSQLCHNIKPIIS